MVIALTHMRTKNDTKLADEVEVDLILGGHDHVQLSYQSEKTGVVMIKSGTDFEEFTDITLFFDK